MCVCIYIYIYIYNQSYMHKLQIAELKLCAKSLGYH